MELKPIDIRSYTHILILTGAGISAASGLPTFRGPDGMLTPEAMWNSNAANLPRSLPGMWQMYGGLKQKALQSGPNPAHQTIAEMQKRWGNDDRSITVVTQNVDGLHTRAGSPDVVEMHGSVMRCRCTHPHCKQPPYEDAQEFGDPMPTCSSCGDPLRLDIVLFGEPIPPRALQRIEQGLIGCDLFIAVGTSGTVVPAADLVRYAAQQGARTILVNLTPMEPRNPYFQEEYLGRAEEILPTLLGL
jgi:NAD-dependent deacetylase